MKIKLTAQQMHNAFMIAEAETAEHFGGATCALKTKDGNSECPICDFHIRYRKHLGINEEEYQWSLGNGG